jgi:hypothetical protein
VAQPVVARVRKRPRQRHDDCRKIRLRAATGKVRHGLGGEAELTSQPRQYVAFHLVRGRRGMPCRKLWIVHRGERVRDDRRRRHARVEKTEIAWMRDLYLPGLQHPLHIGADGVQRQGLRKVIARRQVAPNLLGRHLRNDGTGRDGGFELCHRTQ